MKRATEGVWGLEIGTGASDYQQRVCFTSFWRKHGVALGNNMWWEAWITRHSIRSTGYLISDGYGGAHALLWGLNTGNIWKGGSYTSFTYRDYIAYGTIHHNAVTMGSAFDGTDVIATYINGCCVGITPMAGTRTTPTAGGAEGVMVVGGSDHLNGSYTLYQMRAYDQKNLLGANKAGKNFAPSRRFGNRSTASLDPANLPDFLVDCTKQQLLIADHSNGYDSGGGFRIRHPGWKDTGVWDFDINRCKAYNDFAKWTFVDKYHPWTTLSAPVHPDDVLTWTPPSPPVGAVVYDTFTRPEQTFAWRTAPTLGSTESGSAGVKTWQQSAWGGDSLNYGGCAWGILNNKAVCLDDDPRSIAWVDSGIANQKVSAVRWLSADAYCSIALAFRVVDASNFLIASFEAASLSQGRFEIGKVVSGTYTQLWQGSLEAIGSWTTLTVNANGTSISLYADATLKQTITDSTHQSATGAGLCHPGARSTAGHKGYSTSRWGAFTVKAAD